MLKETNVFLGGKTFFVACIKYLSKKIKKEEKRVDYDNERSGTIAFKSFSLLNNLQPHTNTQVFDSHGE